MNRVEQVARTVLLVAGAVVVAIIALTLLSLFMAGFVEGFTSELGR